MSPPSDTVVTHGMFWDVIATGLNLGKADWLSLLQVVWCPLYIFSGSCNSNTVTTLGFEVAPPSTFSNLIILHPSCWHDYPIHHFNWTLKHEYFPHWQARDIHPDRLNLPYSTTENVRILWLRDTFYLCTHKTLYVPLMYIHSIREVPLYATSTLCEHNLTSENSVIEPIRLPSAVCRLAWLMSIMLISCAWGMTACREMAWLEERLILMTTRKLLSISVRNPV